MNAEKHGRPTHTNGFLNIQNLAVGSQEESNRISGGSGLSGLTNTLHLGAQGYQTQSDCGTSEKNYG